MCQWKCGITDCSDTTYPEKGREEFRETMRIGLRVKMSPKIWTVGQIGLKNGTASQIRPKSETVH